VREREREVRRERGEEEEREREGERAGGRGKERRYVASMPTGYSRTRHAKKQTANKVAVIFLKIFRDFGRMRERLRGREESSPMASQT
jgi:hypothetical protein